MDEDQTRSTTRYDIAAAILHYWWAVLVLWLIYSGWTIESIAAHMTHGH